MEKRNNIAPAQMPIHLGEILLEELRERGLSQKAFAAQIGMSTSHLNELIHGKMTVTMAIADKLEKGLGIDSQFWTNLQTDYNYKVKALEGESTDEQTVKLEVSIVEKSLLADIRRAIGLIRGVGRVAVL